MERDDLIFNWRHKFLAQGIDAQAAEAEMKRIEKKFGKLTPKIVLEASRPKRAFFHKCFEWRDGIAAEKYRLQQARFLINNIEVTIVRQGSENVKIPFYEVVKDSKGKNMYTDVTSIISNPDNLSHIKYKAKRDLEYWKAKYELYEELSSAVSQVNKALHSM
jgi:hypothetical protein